MTMNTVCQVTFVDPRDEPSWDAQVAGLPGATVFHGSAWARCLCETYDFAPCYAVLRDGSALVAAQPLMEVRKVGGRVCGVALPFTDACPVVAHDARDRAVLVAAIQQEALLRGWRRVEFRGPVDKGGATVSARYCLHEVDLGVSEDDLRARCNPSVRRALRKAVATGLHARCGSDADDVAVFYRLLTKTRRRHGLPPPPRAFLEAIWRNLLVPGNGTIVTVWKDGRSLAAAVFLRWGRVGLFKFGASEAEGLEWRPNDLAMMEGFRWCRAAGCTRVSLGRTASGQEGLLRFKRGWAAAESPLDYHTYDAEKGAFIAGHGERTGWYTPVFRHLPLPLLQWAGRVLYRQAA